MFNAANGYEERYARERKGHDLHSVATSYAFFEGDADRLSCDYGTPLRLYIRRKNSAEVTPVTVRGHWQPTYQAYPAAPVKIPLTSSPKPATEPHA